MTAVVRAERVTKEYSLGGETLRVLKGVSLLIEPGESVALVGTSGSGKSTLMNILGLLDRPTSGSYELDGVDTLPLGAAARARARNRTIGFVFQNFNLLPKTSAVDNVMMPLWYSADPPPPAEGRARAEELLAAVGLGGRLGHHPSELSGGQQQRVAVARALVCRPRLLLADEPTGNLDSATSREILEMFARLNAEEGLTVLIVTHDDEVAASASRAVRVKDGEIVEDRRR